jgi:TIR domain/Pentapeptide repeats (8 copies)
MVNDYDVFLSYSRADAQVYAEAITQRLRSEGLRVWRDQSLAVGESLVGGVRQAMERARVIVVLISAGAARSEWVATETAYALRRQSGLVVPVVLDKDALDSPLGSLLGDRVWVDVVGKAPQRAAEHVAAAIQASGLFELRQRRLRRTAYLLSVFVALLLVLSTLAWWAASQTTPSRLAARITRGAATKNQNGANLVRTNLAGVRLEGFDFRGALLSEVNLTGAVLSFAKLNNATLSQALMQGVVANSASFAGSTLVAADLRRANLSNSTLENADLRLADLRGAVFVGATLDGVKLDGAMFDSSTKWPENFEPFGRGAKCLDCPTR